MSKSIARSSLALALSVGIGGFALAGPPPAAAGDHAVLVGRWDEGGRGQTTAMGASGTIAYVGVGRNLMIFDVADPANPRRLSRLELPAAYPGGFVWDIAVADSRVYIADGEGLTIVDVSNPVNPRILSHFVPSETYQPLCFEVAVTGSYVLLLDNYNPSVVRVIDASNPGAPVEVSTLNGSFYHIAASGHYLYAMGAIPGRSYGLHVVDLSNPSVPTVVGVFPSDAIAVAAAGRYVYLAGFQLEVLDVADPAAPVVVGTSETFEGGGRMILSGGYAFVSTGSDFERIIRIFDVSNPTAPNQAGSYAFSRGDTITISMAVSGNRLYLPDGDLAIVDVSKKASPTEVGRYTPPPGNSATIDVSGSTAIVGETELWGNHRVLRNVDVSNPAAPTEVGSYDVPGSNFFGYDWLWENATSANYAVVAAENAGLRIVDTSNPATPVEVGFEPSLRALTATVSGNFAYVLSLTQGSLSSQFAVVDISNPTTPQVRGTTPEEFGGYTVAVSGNRAYVLDGASQIHVVDVSSPDAPVEIALYPVSVEGYLPGGIAVSGSLVFVTEDGAWSGAVHVLDFSDPAAPVEVAVYHFAALSFPWLLGDLRDATLSGSLLYVVDAQGGRLRILDVSNPAAPVEVGSYPVPAAWRVTVSGDYIYVSARSDGLYVLARDRDGDQVGDPTDACPASINTPTVQIDACDSGVSNSISSAGCTLSDQLAVCGSNTGDPGSSWSRCVKQTLQALKHDGQLTTKQVNAIEACTRKPPKPKHG